MCLLPRSTQQQTRNLFGVEEDNIEIEQCCAARIVRSFQQYYLAL